MNFQHFLVWGAMSRILAAVLEGKRSQESRRRNRKVGGAGKSKDRNRYYCGIEGNSVVHTLPRYRVARSKSSELVQLVLPPHR